MTTTAERERMKFLPIGWKIEIDGAEWRVLRVNRTTGNHLMARTDSANPDYYDRCGPLNDLSYDVVESLPNDSECLWKRPDE